MKNLKARRTELGMTQQQLGEAVGLSRFAIIEYEAGSKSPTVENAKRMAAALKTTVEYLIGESENVNPTPRPQQTAGGAE